MSLESIVATIVIQLVERVAIWLLFIYINKLSIYLCFRDTYKSKWYNEIIRLFI